MSRKGKEAVFTPGKWLLSGGIGVLISFVFSVAALALSAYLISNGTIDERSVGRCCAFALLLGCLSGGYYAARAIGSRVLLCALSVSVAAAVLWCCIGQGMFGGYDLPALLRSLITALLGAMGAATLAAFGKKSRN